MKIGTMDVGTTGAKVMIFDEEGKVLSGRFREYPVNYPREGWAEQDAENVCRIVLELLGGCIADAGTKELDGLSLSVQGDALIPTDRNGTALHPAILGMDGRSERQAEQCAESFGARFLFEKTGMRPHPVNFVTKILWLVKERPEIAKKTEKYLTYDSFIWKRLGSDLYVTDLTMASRSMLCGLESGEWDPEILERCEIEREKLPDIVHSGSVIGRLASETAKKLHLKNRPYLIAGGHDQTCAGVGAGAVAAGIAVDSHGTAEVLSAGFCRIPDRESMFNGFYPCYRHCVPGQYFTFALNHSGGIVFRWFRDQLAKEEMERAHLSGKSAYDLMVEEMEDGPSGLLFFPHLNGSGTPSCDMYARGSLLGVSLSTTKQQIGKALLEGLSYEMRYNILCLGKAGVSVKDIRCVGGGASHRRVLQWKADVLGQPVSSMKNREAASLGAAIMALYGLGFFHSVEEGVKCLVKPERTFEPDRERAKIYTELFALYQQAYRVLEPLYRKWGERSDR